MNNTELKSYTHIYQHNKNSKVKWWFFICTLVFIIFLFLPWTQNVRAKGTVTTLYQDQRPQQVNSIIGGQVIKWHVKEGDYVQAGDTLVQLTEVKPTTWTQTFCNEPKSNWQVKNYLLNIIKAKWVLPISRLVPLIPGFS